MTPVCIHGFHSEQCASCRTCLHGSITSQCPRCLDVTPSAARRRRAALSADSHPVEQHAGFEIFFEPSLSGWQYRGADSASSPLSYRSVFLARKAIDQVVAKRPA